MALTAKDLIEKLQELDPDEEIWVQDMEYGDEPAFEFYKKETDGVAGPKADHWFITGL